MKSLCLVDEAFHTLHNKTQHTEDGVFVGVSLLTPVEAVPGQQAGGRVDAGHDAADDG